jgi:hypothetical protein
MQSIIKHDIKKQSVNQTTKQSSIQICCLDRTPGPIVKHLMCHEISHLDARYKTSALVKPLGTLCKSGFINWAYQTIYPNDSMGFGNIGSQTKQSLSIIASFNPNLSLSDWAFVSLFKMVPSVSGTPIRRSHASAPHIIVQRAAFLFSTL